MLRVYEIYNAAWGIRSSVCWTLAWNINLMHVYQRCMPLGLPFPYINYSCFLCHLQIPGCHQWSLPFCHCPLRRYNHGWILTDATWKRGSGSSSFSIVATNNLCPFIKVSFEKTVRFRMLIKGYHCSFERPFTIFVEFNELNLQSLSSHIKQSCCRNERAKLMLIIKLEGQSTYLLCNICVHAFYSPTL